MKGTAYARERFLRVLDRLRGGWGFGLLGYVVMPEHEHLLMSEPEKHAVESAADVEAEGIAGVEAQTKEEPGQMALRFLAEAEAPAFWQRRFYDFNVWSAKKLFEKLEYARESGEPEAGVACGRLAVEQLVTLCDTAAGIDCC